MHKILSCNKMGLLLSKNAVIMRFLSVPVLLVHPWYIVTKRKGSEPLEKLGTRINTGADNRTRTYDLLITNEPLYQLSYTGMSLIIIFTNKRFVNINFLVVKLIK